MNETVLTYPQEATEQDALIASVYIEEHQDSDLMCYVDDLIDQGFVFLDEELYDEQNLTL